MCRRFSILLFILLPGIFSCDSDLFDFDRYKGVEVEPTIALPVVFAKYSMGDLISKVDSVVNYETDSDGTIILYYEDSASGLNLLDQFSIPSQNFRDTFRLDISEPVILPEGQRILSDTIPFSYQLTTENKERLDSVFINTGQIDLGIVSHFPCDINIYFRVHSIVRDDTPLTSNIHISYDGSSSQYELTQIDLSDTKFDFTLGSQYNLIRGDIVFECVSSGVEISPDDYLALNFNMNVNSIHSLFGYVGNQVIAFPEESVGIDFFEIFDKGITNFELPNVTIDVKTNAGLNLAAYIRTFYATRSDSGTTYDITGTFLDSLYFIEGPTSGDIDDFSTTSIKVNSQNSNLRDVFSKLPSELIFEINAETNPFSDSTHNNYLFNNTSISADYRIDLPLNLTIYDLHVDDTVDVDLGEFEADELAEVSLRIIARNGIPLGGNMIMNFLDQNNNMLIDLLNGPKDLIRPGETGTEGLPSASVEEVTEIKLSREQIEMLTSVSKMAYDISFNTYRSEENQLVRITEQSEVEIKVSILATFKSEIEF